MSLVNSRWPNLNVLKCQHPNFQWKSPKEPHLITKPTQIPGGRAWPQGVGGGVQWFRCLVMWDSWRSCGLGEQPFLLVRFWTMKSFAMKFSCYWTILMHLADTKGILGKDHVSWDWSRAEQQDRNTLSPRLISKLPPALREPLIAASLPSAFCSLCCFRLLCALLSSPGSTLKLSQCQNSWGVFMNKRSKVCVCLETETTTYLPRMEGLNLARRGAMNPRRRHASVCLNVHFSGEGGFCWFSLSLGSLESSVWDRGHVWSYFVSGIWSREQERGQDHEAEKEIRKEVAFCSCPLGCTCFVRASGGRWGGGCCPEKLRGRMLSEASLCQQAVTVHTEPDQETGSVQGPEALKEILQLCLPSGLLCTGVQLVHCHKFPDLSSVCWALYPGPCAHPQLKAFFSRLWGDPAHLLFQRDQCCHPYHLHLCSSSGTPSAAHTPPHECSWHAPTAPSLVLEPASQSPLVLPCVSCDCLDVRIWPWVLSFYPPYPPSVPVVGVSILMELTAYGIWQLLCFYF